ncbi:prephenate dehydrogenase/arogenate dehydrogenase family protein [Pelagibacteraceae bacterium]|nr:prephenate dehydrogenase/arogenate dehydrogenase family protein [Pelagibacteraceae bacterium]
MFNKISIIGCGLIGSSILRAVVEKKLVSKISVYDKASKVTDYLKKNFSVEICSNVSDVVKESDLVIIASPLSSYKEILLSIQSNLKENVILTDTGSAKKEVNKIISNLNLKNINWIASHPIAGTEYSGPEAGLASLFKNRWCIISADKKVAEDKIKSLENFWSKLGSKTKFMTFEDHDYVLSLTSHLPHAVAYSIVKTAINNEDKFKDDVIQYSAGGLRDFTRIAASDPLMWKDIFIDNSDNILKVLDSYSKNLNEIKDAIKNKDSEKLLEIFSSTKKVRKEIIEAGQDTDKPGFGRK